jgi:5,10-methylenetetrahydrofolate reductase
VYQITARDRNRLAIQSELLTASILGVENVLCLTGDAITSGDHQQAKPVFDLDAVQMIQVTNGLNEGVDAAGNKLSKSPDFFIGAAVSPNAEPLEPEIIKMEKKIDGGAKFFQTQAVFDIKRFERFVKSIPKKDGVYLLAGIVVLKSEKMAKFMNDNISGIEVPQELIIEMESSSKKKAKGIEIAARIIKEVKGLVDGVHIMSLGWGDIVPEIISLAGLST